MVIVTRNNNGTHPIPDCKQKRFEAIFLRYLKEVSKLQAFKKNFDNLGKGEDLVHWLHRLSTFNMNKIQVMIDEAFNPRETPEGYNVWYNISTIWFLVTKQTCTMEALLKCIDFVKTHDGIISFEIDTDVFTNRIQTFLREKCFKDCKTHNNNVLDVTFLNGL